MPTVYAEAASCESGDPGPMRGGAVRKIMARLFGIAALGQFRFRRLLRWIFLGIGGHSWARLHVRRAAKTGLDVSEFLNRGDTW